MPTMNILDAPLVEMYRARGVLTDANSSVHLPSQCPRSSSCWAGQPPEHVPSREELGGQLSAPWIGPAYDRGRTLLLLENLREYGGFDLGHDHDPRIGMRFLAVAAKASFAAGQKRLFRTPAKKYPGTLVWHRAAAYAATWLSAEGLLDIPSAHALEGQALAAAMDRLAMVQHVKCSPKVGRGEQTPAMWSNCGEHLLKEEIAILKPARIIVLGNGENFFNLRRVVLQGGCQKLTEEAVMIGEHRTRVFIEQWGLGEGTVDVLVVPHPAWPGGTSNKLLAAVASVVARHQRPEPIA